MCYTLILVINRNCNNILKSNVLYISRSKRSLANNPIYSIYV